MNGVNMPQVVRNYMFFFRTGDIRVQKIERGDLHTTAWCLGPHGLQRPKKKNVARPPTRTKSQKDKKKRPMMGSGEAKKDSNDGTARKTARISKIGEVNASENRGK